MATNIYTISQISKDAGYYRVGVSKFVNSDKRFKKTIQDFKVVFESNLSFDEIKTEIEKIKTQKKSNNIQKYNIKRGRKKL